MRRFLIALVLLLTYTTLAESAPPGGAAGGGPRTVVASPRYYIIASDAAGMFQIDRPNTWRANGTADDVLIQLVNDLIAAGTGEGEIELSPGSFAIAATITLGSNVTLSGAGAGKTTFTLDNNVDEPILVNTAFEDGGDTNTNITVRGITFDGNRANQTSANVSTYVDNLGNTGTLFFMEVTGIRVENCTVNNAAWAGVCAVECTDVWLVNNRVDNSNDDSLAIDRDCDRATVSQNHLTDVGKDNDYGGPAGIEVQDSASHVTVTNNHIVGGTAAGAESTVGISVNSHTGESAPHDIVISGNTIESCTAGGIITDGNDAAEWPFNITITNNVIRAVNLLGQSDGIRLLKMRRGVVTGNIIYKDDSSQLLRAFPISEAEDVVIANNIAYVLASGNNASDVAVRIGHTNNENVNLDRVKIVDNTFINWDDTFFRIDDGDGTADWDDVVIARNMMASPDVTTANTSIWNDTAPATYTNCYWTDNTQAEAVNNQFSIVTGSSFGDSNWKYKYFSATRSQINLVGTWGINQDGANTNGGGISGSDSVTLTEQSASFAKAFDASEGGGTWGNINVAAARGGYAANYQLFPGTPAATDAVAFGAQIPFCEVAFDTSTQAVYNEAAVLVWQYSTGTSTWSTLTLATNQTGTTDVTGEYFAQQDGAMTFIPPSDWVQGTVDGTQLYWIRAVIQADKADNMTTSPILNSKEHELVKPTDAPAIASDGLITAIRISDRSAILHTGNDVKYLLMNFTRGTHSGELTFAQDLATDRWSGLSMRCEAGDEIGVLCTQEDGTNEVDDCTLELTIE